MEDYNVDIRNYINTEIEVLKSLDINAINTIINELEKARKSVHNIYIMGNGGSAATASHFVCDFNKGISCSLTDKYNFICLNDNVPSLMAIANDTSYDNIFVEQLRGRIVEKDILIAVSGSGNSKNIVKAAEYAKEMGAIVIGVTGYDGGKVKQISNYNFHVCIDDMQITEDVHMMFDHLMMSVLCKRLH